MKDLLIALSLVFLVILLIKTAKRLHDYFEGYHNND